MSQKPKQNLFKLLDTKSVAYVGYVDADNPLTVFATKMPENCQIQFEKIEFSDDVISTACGCDVGELLVDVLSIDPYKLCNCTPLIDSKNKSIVIDEVGHYQAVIAGDCIGEVEAWAKQSPELKGKVNDIQRGCCKPCEHIEFSLTEVTQTSVKVQLIKGSQATIKVFNGIQNFTQISEENLQILPFNGLEAGKTYSILVENECDKASVNFTTGEPAPIPPCPTLSITAVVLSDTSIKVTVNSGGPAIVTVGDQEAEITTNHTFTGLQAGKTYTAKGVNSCGNKAYSTVTTTSPAPPPVPVPDPCPSYAFVGGGFGYFSVDGFPTGVTSKAVNVVHTIGGVNDSFTVFISTTRVAGHTHPVRNTSTNAVIGFASNTSCCAPNWCLDESTTVTYTGA